MKLRNITSLKLNNWQKCTVLGQILRTLSHFGVLVLALTPRSNGKIHFPELTGGLIGQGREVPTCSKISEMKEALLQILADGDLIPDAVRFSNHFVIIFGF